jgi:hypothetical protein
MLALITAASVVTDITETLNASLKAVATTEGAASYELIKV